MSACSQQNFNGITQARWNCIKEAVKNKTGIVITTDSGTATQSGFTVQWNFVASSTALSIQFIDRPWIIPCSAVEKQINDVVQGCP